MASVVVDTHAAVWYLHQDAQLSVRARTAIRNCIRDREAVFVASISLVEITYLVEKRRLPLAALDKLRNFLVNENAGFAIADLDLAVADAVARISRDSVPDLPDRVIAATALALGLPLVSRDRRIQAAALDTIW